MNEPERILEKIWTEFLVKVVRPETPNDQLKYIAEIFQWGAMLMAREIMQNQNEFLFELSKDFKLFSAEVKGEAKNEQPN